MQIGLYATSLDLLDILPGDTGGSHLQTDEPVRIPWGVIDIGKKK